MLYELRVLFPRWVVDKKVNIEENVFFISVYAIPLARPVFISGGPHPGRKGIQNWIAFRMRLSFWLVAELIKSSLKFSKTQNGEGGGAFFVSIHSYRPRKKRWGERRHVDGLPKPSERRRITQALGEDPKGITWGVPPIKSKKNKVFLPYSDPNATNEVRLSPRAK